MSFQFRFAALLQLRRRQRDEAGATVGQASEAISRIDQQIEEIQRQRQSLRQESSTDRSGDFSVDRLLAQGRYDMQLEAETQSLQQTRLQLTGELTRRQQALVAAEAEVKRFERLEETDRSAHDARLLQREQLEADDATARRYTTQRQRQSHDR